MNPTNKLAYIRHMYSGPRKSRKKVQATLKRHHGNSSNDFYRLEAWRNNKKKVVEETADCPVVFSPNTTQDHDQLSNPSTAQDTPKTYSRGRPQIRFEAIACSSSSNRVESVTEQVETVDFGWPQPDPLTEAYQLTVEDEPLSEKEIRVFCPKCKTEITHTAEGMQDDQTKILVAKVYHYFEQEYKELKTIYGDLDLTPLSKFRQRTALATGVSESTVLHILQEEEGRNAETRQEPPKERRRPRKRYRETNSSSEDDSSDDNAGNKEQSSNPQDAEMLVVKVESPESNNEEPEIYFPVSTVKAEVSEGNMEQAQNDPISLDVKTEPQADVVDNTSETLALTEPAGTKRKGRIIPRRRDVTSARTSETLALTEPAGTKRKGRIIPRRRDVTSARSSLIGDKEMEAEEREEEEGIS